MIDKWMAIKNFWKRFNLPAYDENTLPDNISMPYITYESSTSDFDERIQLSASLWYYSTLWDEISQKASEIEELIGGGYSEPYDNGRIWITKDYPFAQRMNEPGSDMTRRMVIHIVAEFQ